MQHNQTVAIGIDVGSVSVKGVALDRDGNLVATALMEWARVFSAGLGPLLSELGLLPGSSVPVGATGGGRDFLKGVAGVHFENDLVAATRAAARLHPGCQGIVEIGGHQSKWTRLGPAGEMESFSLNDQCAAGSGAFLEQQAGRLRMGLEEFAAMAGSAKRAASVAGRCAVFAKSDMIHLQQKGTPAAEIAYGLCVALARNYRATLLRGGEMATPALFTGGGALNAGLYRAFGEVFSLGEDELLSVEQPLHYPALGVALAALEQGDAVDLKQLSGAVAQSESGTEDGGPSKPLPPLRPPVMDLQDEPVVAPEGPFQAFLGVDVGSVSTDFCLLTSGGEVIDGLYLRTRGDPIGVLREGLAELKSRVGNNLEVLGVGTTGSGRHLAGSLLGADVVKNEITCQLLGARHVLPEVDTILEIGGQDSKYVSVRGGRIVDFVMNKICAAGTGSFLEEQGETLGVSIKEEFSDLALTSESPADLGSQCTVFMDSEVVNARQQRRPLPDLLAGLAYSVARNYLERVVAGRPVGEKVVFQGGVASNESVIAAFENLLGKQVAVHPNNRISGAIGAALAARDGMKPGISSFRGLDAVESVKVKTFECKACSNMCQVARISVGDAITYFGDVCEKYAARQSSQEDNSVLLPDLVAEVESLLESYAGGEAWHGTAGIPRASMMYDLFPFWATLLKNLGFRVVLGGKSNMKVLEEGVRRVGAETCLPVKLVYGHSAELLVREEIDFVFLPAVVEIADQASDKSHLCPFEESAGFMVGAAAPGRVLVPTVSLAAPRHRIIRELREKFAAYDLSDHEVSEALDAAQEAQDEYHRRLRKRGEEVLASDFGLAFALLGKPYNIVDAFENLNVARHLRRLSVLPIPMQMLPVKARRLSEHGISIPWKYNRDIVQAVMSLRDDDRIFPLVVSNFGCGPDAFSAGVIDEAAGGMPYLFLEFDEHRGEAGLITRLEAFIDEVSNVAARRRSKPLRLKPVYGSDPDRHKGRRIVLPYFADHVKAYYGALRCAGYEVTMLPPPDDETLAYGEEISSGKECHPFVIVAGDLLKHLERGNIVDGDVYLFPGTATACLLHQYGAAMQLVLDRKGVSGIEILSPDGPGHMSLFGLGGLTRLGRGLLACDHLTKLKRQVRPYAKDPAGVDRLFDEVLDEMGEELAADRLRDVLRDLGPALEEIALTGEGPRPLVGVAGDVYTRIHAFGNLGMFDKLEELGLEVWPAPFLTDSVEFGFGRDVAEGLGDGKYLEAAGSALLYLKKGMEDLKVRLMLGRRVQRGGEPGYQDVLRLAEPYLDKAANEFLILNVAKMVDFAQNGAHGVINAISFHCMLGTVAASLTEAIRRDNGMVPITTILYTGKPSPDIDTKLEAFAHQVKEFAGRRRERGEESLLRSWFAFFRS